MAPWGRVWRVGREKFGRERAREREGESERGSERERERDGRGS